MVSSGAKKAYLDSIVNRFYCDHCNKKHDLSRKTVEDLSRCQFTQQMFGTTIHMPGTIRYPFHKCHLSLRRGSYSALLICEACEHVASDFCYVCDECSYTIHVSCIQNVPQCLETALEHFGHVQSHPFHGLKLENLSESGNNFDDFLIMEEEDLYLTIRYCYACEKQCIGAGLICQTCSFCVHESCLGDLGIQKHPFHKQHNTLALTFRSSKAESPCRVCWNVCHGLVYVCSWCKHISIMFHPQCLLQAKFIQDYKYHDNHIVTYAEDVSLLGGLPCAVCNEKNYKGDKQPMLCCVECEYRVHVFSCSRQLPSFVKHKSHIIHPLTLVESPLDDEHNEFACDVCEEIDKRDPRLPIYFCQKCYFVAEPRCCIYEVKASLRGDNGDMELKDIPNVKGAGMISTNVFYETTNLDNEASLFFFVKRFTDGEVEQVKSVLEEARRHTLMDIMNIKPNKNQGSKQRDEACKALDVCYLSDHFYFEFLERLDDYDTNIRPLDQGNIDLVSLLFCKNQEIDHEVGDYLVTRSLAPTLDLLCTNYGDLWCSRETLLSQQVKTYFVNMLCSTIDKMCSTKDNGMSQTLLQKWWFNLKALKCAGLNVQFGLDHFWHIVDAFYGIHLKNQVDHVKKEIGDRREKLKVQLKDLNKQLEDLQLKEDDLERMESTASVSLKNCIEKGLKIRWRAARLGFFG